MTTQTPMQRAIDFSSEEDGRALQRNWEVYHDILPAPDCHGQSVTHAANCERIQLVAMEDYALEREWRHWLRTESQMVPVRALIAAAGGDAGPWRPA